MSLLKSKQYLTTYSIFKNQKSTINLNIIKLTNKEKCYIYLYTFDNRNYIFISQKIVS